MSFAQLLLASSPWATVYDGDDELDLKDVPAEHHDRIKKMIETERSKSREQTQKALDELTTLRTKASLTANERKELDARVEQLQNELLTKEQISAKEKDKLKKEHEKAVTDLSSDRDRWKSAYTNESIQRAIQDAAIENEAFYPEQIVALLRNETRLIEELDAEGKPAGRLVPKVRFNDTDKDGKPIALELTPKEAVKRMSEIDKFFNLFKGKGVGGLGGNNNNGRGGEIDLSSLVNDPEKYRAARKSGKLKI